VLRYQSRISGPLLDRIDIQIEVAAMDPADMAKAAGGEPSATIAARVARARERQLARQQKPNFQMTTHEIDRYCKLGSAAEAKLHSAMKEKHWSARAYHRVLKVARTIADLADEKTINEVHVGEAVQLRSALKER
jgi:magnesium chelatase family protein